MKLKTILIVTVCISIASACGVSAKQLVPPVLVDLDSKYLDGAVLNGISQIGHYGSSKVHQVKDFVVLNIRDVLSGQAPNLEKARDSLTDSFDTFQS